MKNTVKSKEKSTAKSTAKSTTKFSMKTAIQTVVIFAIAQTAMGLAHADQTTLCPDFTGSYTCAADAQYQTPASSMQVTQVTTGTMTVYTYVTTDANNSVSTDVYTAYSDHVTGIGAEHMFCSNGILYCNPGPATTTFYYYLDSDGNYHGGQVGKSPITCLRVPAVIPPVTSADKRLH